MTIIERDLEFYKGERERLLALYRSCSPDAERAYHLRIVAVESVIAALTLYREILPTV